MKRLTDLSCRLIYEHGHSIVLEKDPPLRNEDMVFLEMKMLNNCSIPHLLPLEFIEIDRKIKLRYDIAAKRPLYMAVRPEISAAECLNILLSVISILEESKTYLLNENRYLLDSQYLFVGKDRTDIHLMYLPIHELGEVGELAEQFVALAGWLSVQCSAEDRHHALNALDDIRKTPFHLHECKRKLLTALNRLNEIEFSKSHFVDRSTTGPTVSGSLYGKGDEREGKERCGPWQNMLKNPVSSGDQIKKTIVPENQFGSTVMSNSNSKNLVEPNIKKSKQPSHYSGQVIIGILCGLILAVWYLYALRKSSGYMNLSLGVTLFSIDAMYVIGKLGLFSEENEKGQEKRLAMASSLSLATPPAPANFREYTVPGEYQERDENALERPDAGARYYSGLAGETTLLSHGDATCLLSEEELAKNNRIPCVYLEIQRDGNPDQVTLTDKPFIIGRDSTSVQFTDDTFGVSRQHLEFIKSGEGYAARDLGSKNGSKRNGEWMVPYQEYLLEDGDSFEVLKLRLICRIV